jgi:hypothetical protein
MEGSMKRVREVGEKDLWTMEKRKTNIREMILDSSKKGNLSEKMWIFYPLLSFLISARWRATNILYTTQ